MRETYVTVVGNVVDTPRVVETTKGAVFAKFRLAATPRTMREGQWEDGTTSYYEITCFKRLGENVAASLVRGEPVIVHGKLEVREWESGDRSGKDVQITANHVGHDLSFGLANFQRPGRTVTVPAPEDFGGEATEAA